MVLGGHTTKLVYLTEASVNVKMVSEGCPDRGWPPSVAIQN